MRIIRHRATSVEDLRARLKAVLGKPKRRECPACAGSGHVDTPVTQVEVAQALGLPTPALNGFVKGKSLNLERGLKLLAWLEDAERDPLAELDDQHQPKAPTSESERMRQLREASSRAAADAAINGRNRPLEPVNR
jgi:hypothetical protein